MARAAPGDLRGRELAANQRTPPLTHCLGSPTPFPPERRVAGYKCVSTIFLLELRNARRRDRIHPASGPLHCPDRIRIVHRDRSVLFNDPAASFRHLPFHRVAGQPFVRGSLPHITPTMWISTRPFASLDLGRHLF